MPLQVLQKEMELAREPDFKWQKEKQQKQAICCTSFTEWKKDGGMKNYFDRMLAKRMNGMN